jgi:hypothetical protein
MWGPKMEVHLRKLDAGKWTSVGVATNVGLYDFSLVPAGSRIFAWDGAKGVSFAKDGSFELIPPGPSAGSKEHGATAIGVRLFSWAAKGVYDPVTRAWTPLSAIHRPSFGACPARAFSDGKYVYVTVDERETVHSMCKQAARWDSATDSWLDLTAAANWPWLHPRSTFAAGHLVLWSPYAPADGRFLRVP